MQLLKLNTIVHDKIIDVDGTLTHSVINMDHHVNYIFQPKGIDEISKLPVDKMYVEAARIIGGEYEEVEIPLNILGTEVEEIGSGFKGIITGIVIHLGNCIHAEVTPKGVLKTDRRTAEIDLRRLVGDAIPKLTKEEVKDSEKKFPSPIGTPMRKIITRFC